MRTFGLLLALSLITTAAVPGAAQERGPDTWYTQRMTTGPGPVLIEQLWAKGNRLRSLAVVRGRPILTLVDGERYVIIEGVNGTGVSIERSPRAIAQDASRGRPFGREGKLLLGKAGEPVGTEVLAGQEVDHYRITNRRGREELWVTRDDERLPVRYVRWDRATRHEIQYHYLDWVRAAEFPDSFFSPPPGATLERVSYDDYVTRSKTTPVGPAPPFFASLLHGTRPKE